MKKNTKIIIVLALALAFAVAAGVLLIQLLNPLQATIYVFNDSYPAGTTIQSSMLTAMQVDSKIVIAGSKTDLYGYFITPENFPQFVTKGDTLRSSVGKGKAFMASDIATVGQNEVEVRMAPDAIAITISANNVTAVTSALKPECHVNVYSTPKNGVTHLLLENIRVLAVAVKEGNIAGVTLELNNVQAEALINAEHYGALTLGLVQADGYIYVTPTDSYANSYTGIDTDVNAVNTGIGTISSDGTVIARGDEPQSTQASQEATQTEEMPDTVPTLPSGN